MLCSPDLLSVVVPGALGRVAEDIVQHIGGVQNIQLAAPPVAVVCQTVLRHLHPPVPLSEAAPARMEAGRNDLGR